MYSTIGATPGWVMSEQLLKLLSAMYWLTVAGFGFGLAMLDGGVVGLPLPSLQNTESPVPSITWFTAVPPSTDWWKLSLSVKRSASVLRKAACSCSASKK